MVPIIGRAHRRRAPRSARQVVTTCLFLGPFVETATGFGVGFVVALRAVLGLKIPAGTSDRIGGAKPMPGAMGARSASGRG